MPKDVVDQVEMFLEVHKEKLKRKGIKKISHMFERAWYHYKDQVLNNEFKLFVMKEA